MESNSRFYWIDLDTEVFMITNISQLKLGPLKVGL